MPIPEDKRNTNGFDKNSQNINKKGRPKKIYTILKETGYSKDDIRTIFLELPMYSMDELKNVTKKKEVPALVLIVAKAIEQAINKGDYKQVKEILEQVIGKPEQHVKTDQNITADITTNELDYTNLSVKTLEFIEKDLKDKEL